MAFNTYQPKIDDYIDRVIYLTSEGSNLNSTVSRLEAENSGYLSQISDLQSEIRGFEEELADAERTISEYREEVSNLEDEVFIYKKEKERLSSLVELYSDKISDLEEKIELMLDVKATQYYQWDYKGTWEWTIHIPMSLYMEYYERSRPRQSRWIDMAKDPNDDYYIDQLVDKLNEVASEERYSKLEKAAFVVAFVQCLTYNPDSVTTFSDEYPRYPIETLFDRGGDCEDTSILAVALLGGMGYDVALLIYDEHVAVGIAVDTYGTYYEYGGIEYFYVETTNEGWEIGEIPYEYKGEGTHVYPLNP